MNTKKLLLSSIILMAFTYNAHAENNLSTYGDQTNSYVFVDQLGSSLVADLYGDSNSVTATQTQSTAYINQNAVGGTIDLKQVGSGTHLVQDGQKNFMDVIQQNSTATASQKGNNNELGIYQKGIGGDIGFTQNGVNLYGSTSQLGGNNTVGAEQGGNDHTMIIAQNGNTNTTYASQTGGHNVTNILQGGDINRVEVQQNGNSNGLLLNQTSSNNTALLNQNGSGNGWNIYQR